MTTGKKIKRIRLLRGLTQKELGIAAGLHPYIADTRISQYEIDDRVPKKELLEKIAIALGVSVLSLQPFVAGTSDADIMLCLMDIEDEWGSRMLLDSSKQGKSGIFFESPPNQQNSGRMALKTEVCGRRNSLSRRLPRMEARCYP
ncbi:MAG: helix-turn-helix transcriptional regulator [Eubacteriales bacterium]|nr:helix-turn-helix transcriptional regulator [Eubacteriales bacterium]